MLRPSFVAFACFFGVLVSCFGEVPPQGAEVGKQAEFCAKELAKQAVALPPEGRREVLKKALAVVLLAEFGRILPADLPLSEYEKLEPLFLSDLYDSSVKQKQAELFPSADGVAFDGTRLNGSGFARIDQLVGTDGRPIAFDRRLPSKVVPLDANAAERMNQTVAQFSSEPDSLAIRNGIDRLYGLPVKAGIAADGVFFRSYAGKLDDYYYRLVQENPSPVSEMDFYAIAESLPGRRFHPLVGVGAPGSVPAPWFSLGDVLSGGGLLAVDDFRRKNPKYGAENPFFGFAARVLPFLGASAGKNKPGEELRVSSDTIRKAIQNPRRFAPSPVKPIFHDPSRFYGRASGSLYLFVAKRLSKKELAAEIAKIDFATPLPDLPVAPDANIVFSDPSAWKNEEFFKDLPALVDVDTPKKFDPTGLYSDVEQTAETEVPPADLLGRPPKNGEVAQPPPLPPNGTQGKSPFSVALPSKTPGNLPPPGEKTLQASAGAVGIQPIPGSGVQPLPEAPPVVAQLPSLDLLELEKPSATPSPSPSPMLIAQVSKEIPPTMEPLRLSPEEKKNAPAPVDPAQLLSKIEPATPSLPLGLTSGNTSFTPQNLPVPNSFSSLFDASGEEVLPSSLPVVRTLAENNFSPDILPGAAGDFLTAENLVPKIDPLAPMRLEPASDPLLAQTSTLPPPEISVTKETPSRQESKVSTVKQPSASFNPMSFLTPMETKIARLTLSSLNAPASPELPVQEIVAPTLAALSPQKLEPAERSFQAISFPSPALRLPPETEISPLADSSRLRTRLLEVPKPIDRDRLLLADSSPSPKFSIGGLPPSDFLPLPETVGEVSPSEKNLAAALEGKAKNPVQKIIPPLPKGNYVAVVSPSGRASAEYLAKISSNDRQLSENASQINRVNCYLKWLSSALVPVEKEIDRSGGASQPAALQGLVATSEKTEDFLGELLSVREKLLGAREGLLKERGKLRSEIEDRPLQESLARLEAIIGKGKGI